MVKFYASRNLFMNGAWLAQGDEVDVSGFRTGAVKEMLSKGDIFVDASRYVDADSVTGPEGSFVAVVDGSLQSVRNISQLEARLFGSPVSPKFYISPDPDPNTCDGTENDPFHNFTQVTLAVRNHLLAGGDRWASLDIYLFPGNYSDLVGQQVVNQFLNGANHSCYLIKPSQWNASRMEAVNRYPHKVSISLHESGQAVFDKPLYFSHWNQIDIGFPWSTTEGIAAPFIYIADGADWGKTYIYADSLFVDNLVLDNMGFSDLYLGPAQFTPPSGAPGILIREDTYVESYLWNGQGDNDLINLRYPRVAAQDRSALFNTHNALTPPDGEVRDIGNVTYRNRTNSMDVIDGGSL